MGRHPIFFQLSLARRHTACVEVVIPLCDFVDASAATARDSAR
jgi:hypothetical protein